jgi:hypothetical protein
VHRLVRRVVPHVSDVTRGWGTPWRSAR